MGGVHGICPGTRGKTLQKYEKKKQKKRTRKSERDSGICGRLRVYVYENESVYVMTFYNAPLSLNSSLTLTPFSSL